MIKQNDAVIHVYSEQTAFENKFLGRYLLFDLIFWNIFKVMGKMENTAKSKNFDRRMTGAFVIDEVLQEVSNIYLLHIVSVISKIKCL